MVKLCKTPSENIFIKKDKANITYTYEIDVIVCIELCSVMVATI